MNGGGPLAPGTPIRRFILHHVLTSLEESWTCLCVRTNLDFITHDCNCCAYDNWTFAKNSCAAVMFFRSDSLDDLPEKAALLARFIKSMYRRSRDFVSEKIRVCRYVYDCLCIYHRTPLLLVTPDHQHVIHAIQLIGGVLSPSTCITVSRKCTTAKNGDVRLTNAHIKITVRNREPSARMSIKQKSSVLLKRHDQGPIIAIIEPVKETDVFTEVNVVVIELQDGTNESGLKMTVRRPVHTSVSTIELESMWTVDQDGFTLVIS